MIFAIIYVIGELFACIAFHCKGNWYLQIYCYKNEVRSVSWCIITFFWSQVK